MEDWLFNNAGKIFLAIILVFAFAVYKGCSADEATYKEFMRQCQADNKKEYECYAMWRGTRDRNQVVPVPVVVPVGR